MQINMVPMIDLLISCIAFLLMTAVWTQIGAVQAQQPRGAPAPDQPQDQPQDQLKIQISPTGLRVGVNATDMRDINNGPQRYDELKRMLDERHRANAQNREVWLQPDGAVPYQDIIRVMDTVYEVFGLASRNEVTIRFL
ncbi:MAG: biopolymer transporter ExbD [Polyangiales bacterium]